MKTLGFIGGGRITYIFLSALKNKKYDLNNVFVSDTNIDVLNKLKNQFPEIKIHLNNLNTVSKQDIVFVALHPPIIIEILRQITNNISADSIIVSLSPKIKFEQIASILPQTQNIARSIPNSPSIINKGYNPISFYEKISDSAKNELLDLFSVFGKAPIVEESKLEGYAITTAMAPTYFNFQIFHLIKMAETFGLGIDEAKDGVKNMLLGAIDTIFSSNLNEEEVLDLIPAKPLEENKETIIEAYNLNLNKIFQKIK